MPIATDIVVVRRRRNRSLPSIVLHRYLTDPIQRLETAAPLMRLEACSGHCRCKFAVVVWGQHGTVISARSAVAQAS